MAGNRSKEELWFIATGCKCPFCGSPMMPSASKHIAMNAYDCTFEPKHHHAFVKPVITLLNDTEASTEEE